MGRPSIEKSSTKRSYCVLCKSKKYRDTMIFVGYVHRSQKPMYVCCSDCQDKYIEKVNK